MKLTFLGIGAAFCPSLLNTCAYFKAGRHLYLLDCGSTAFIRLSQLGLLEDVDGVTCIISHRHADHTGSLGTLIAYATYVKHFPITLVHPDEKLAQQMDLSGIDRSEYQFTPSECYEDACISVRFHPVQHTPGFAAWGFTLTAEGETIYYSGDGEAPPAHIWEDFCMGRIHRLYQDSGRLPHPGHGDFEALRSACPAQRRSCLYPIHLDCDYRALIEQEGFGLAEVAPME